MAACVAGTFRFRPSLLPFWPANLPHTALGEMSNRRDLLQALKDRPKPGASPQQQQQQQQHGAASSSHAANDAYMAEFEVALEAMQGGTRAPGLGGTPGGTSSAPPGRLGVRPTPASRPLATTARHAASASSSSSRPQGGAAQRGSAATAAPPLRRYPPTVTASWSTGPQDPQGVVPR